MKKLLSIVLINIFLLVLFLNNEDISFNIKKINRFFKGDKYNYYDDIKATLEIPKINFKRGLYDINSPYNNINYNIAFHPESEYPNGSSNTIILGHSGDSQISYFDNLKNLDIGDQIYLTYQNEKIEFIIDDIYKVLKNGNVEIIRNKDKMTLTLITCYLTDYQLVIIAYKK